MKTLLVEDDHALRAAFVRQLERLGHEVTAIEGAARACEIIRDGFAADLVWTDLELKEGDGFDVIRAARACLPGVFILVVSGHGDADHLLGVFRLGADHFLPKPFDPSELQAVLRRAEALRAALRDKVRAWHSFVRCDLSLLVPADMGVAAATASLFCKHARSFLDDDGCRGLQIAVHEILLNAIEHGCLEITHEEKLTALSEERYSELLTARRADPRLGGRCVSVRMTADAANGVTIRVSDPGPGFDPSVLPDPSDPDNLFSPSGRGITMAKLQVDELHYEDGGRTAILASRAKP